MFHNILVALDKSEISQQTFPAAVALAKTNEARLMLLHVLSPFEEQYPNTNALIWQTDGLYPTLHTDAMNYYLDQWEALKQERIEWLRFLAEQANASVETQFSQNFGEPGKMICKLAQTWQADLIIVGRRGRRGLSELFLGSVSNYVLHHAPCSVLVVQGQGCFATETPQQTQLSSV